MKNSLYIYLFVICLTLTSCASRSNKEDAQAYDKIMLDTTVSLSLENRENISMNFSSDSLTIEQKKLFAKRAIQKLEDYYNCLQIISNKKYDVMLRNRGKGIAEDLFVDKMTIQYTLDSISKITEDSLGITIRNIVVSNVIVMRNDSTYQGEILFDEKQTKNFVIRQRTAKFLIKKVHKNFGSNKEIVWEVFLNKF